MQLVIILILFFVCWFFLGWSLLQTLLTLAACGFVMLLTNGMGEARRGKDDLEYKTDKKLK